MQSGCEVLAGQARRSGGAIPFHGFAEFEAALLRLMGSSDRSTQMGNAGFQYVVENYQWNTVLDRFEDLLNVAVESFDHRVATSA